MGLESLGAAAEHATLGPCDRQGASAVAEVQQRCPATRIRDGADIDGPLDVALGMRYRLFLAVNGSGVVVRSHGRPATCTGPSHYTGGSRRIVS
jgi:hypothetical protein